MSLSDSDSELSSAPESGDEENPFSESHVVVKKASVPKKSKARSKNKQRIVERRSSTPPRKPHKTEPLHVSTLADCPELAFIVMFRSRFADAFSKGVPNLGCQDIERGVVDTTPSEQVEHLLCGILSLVLNRKKPVERGHHQRALEEALHTNVSMWPKSWEGKNPFSGGRTFSDMDPGQRLGLLQALINWALVSSEAVRAIIAESYKGNRRDDDINVPISVQPWGRDGHKYKYWLIEGRDDTPFRLYRESNPALKNHTWIAVAGSIEELKSIAQELEEDDGTKHAISLKDKILAAIPRFEDGENKRKKREYRASRKALFKEATTNAIYGAGLYEGRTRGKRIKYTFSDEESGGNATGENASEKDDARSRRNARSLRNTPAPEGPRFTASGRQIRKPATGAYGELKINGSNGTGTGEVTPYTGSENGDGVAGGRLRRSSRHPEGQSDKGRAIDYSDQDSQDSGSGHEEEEWKQSAQDDENDGAPSEWESPPATPLEDDSPKKSLKIILRVNKDKLSASPSEVDVLQSNGQPPPICDTSPGGNGNGQLSPLTEPGIVDDADVVMDDSNKTAKASKEANDIAKKQESLTDHHSLLVGKGHPKTNGAAM